MLTILNQRLSKKLLTFLESRTNSSLRIYYIGYGANLDPDFFARRIKKFETLGPVRLSGFSLDFNTPCEYLHKGFGGVKKSESDSLYGMLYKVAPESIRLLDCLEWVKFGFYKRELIKIEYQNEEIEAFVYIPVNPKENLIPPTSYKNLLLKAAMKMDLPEEYIKFLESVESRENFELDHSFNLSNPARERLLPAKYYVWHDKLREKLCEII